MPHITRFHFIRHGETVWNTQGRIQGWSDSSLTARGRFQASVLASALRGQEFDFAYASSSPRCLHTAQILLAGRELYAQPVDALKEIHLGDWEGRTAEEIEGYDLARYRDYRKAPEQYQPSSGESFAQVTDRVSAWLKTATLKHEGGNILVVTHAMVIRLLRRQAEKIPLSHLWGIAVGHCSYHVLEAGLDNQGSLQLGKAANGSPAALKSKAPLTPVSARRTATMSATVSQG